MTGTPDRKTVRYPEASLLQQRQLFQRAFPDGSDAPAVCCERRSGFRIPVRVAPDFLSPELRAGLRKPEQRTVMAVPETAMNKENGSELRKYEIGTTGKAPDVKAVSEPQPVEAPSYQKLRLCV